MSLLGFDAIGHWAIAHPPDPSATVNVSIGGVAGTGTVGSLTPNVQNTLSQVSGTGTVGSLVANPTKPLTGVAGIGTIGSVTPSVSVTITGVAGVGTVGSTVEQVAKPLTGVAGVGTVGTFTPSLSPATLIGVAGIGAVGTFVPSPSGNPLGVSGVGVARGLSVVVSGGGGGRRKPSGGLERIKPKKPPEAPSLASVPIPPFKPAPKLVPAAKPIRLVERSEIPSDLLALRDQILAAEQESFSLQDEQDAADIAEILALLD